MHIPQRSKGGGVQCGKRRYACTNARRGVGLAGARQYVWMETIKQTGAPRWPAQSECSAPCWGWRRLAVGETEAGVVPVARERCRGRRMEAERATASHKGAREQEVVGDKGGKGLSVHGEIMFQRRAACATVAHSCVHACVRVIKSAYYVLRRRRPPSQRRRQWVVSCSKKDWQCGGLGRVCGGGLSPEGDRGRSANVIEL